jgi:Tol biopolymer transport system component/DNA-binding winged helix-turn-helix (wHTH) protein
MHEPSTTHARFVRFGVFELDVCDRELRKAGVPINLPEQPLKILEALLETPGALVSREVLRQRLWGDDTFVDFEHGLNAAVKRLRDVLDDSADAPRFIETVPRRGYRFVGAVEQDPTAPASPPVSAPTPEALIAPRRAWPRRAFAAAALLALALPTAWWLSSRVPATPAGPPPRVVPLTALGGFEVHPTFSPDGGQVAFAWSPVAFQPCDPFDIHVTIVGSMQTRRLTDDPGTDFGPRWSPDGRYIAFMRDSCGSDGARLRVMAALGGSERALTDFKVVPPMSWSPDGRFIAVVRPPSGADPDREAGIWLVPTQDGAPRALTSPVTLGDIGHRAPTFSPDGRRLAYVACPEPLNCHVDVLELDASLAPVGKARRLTQSGFNSPDTLAWTSDDAAIVFDNLSGYAVSYLWRVPVDASGPAERLEVAGLGAQSPATTPNRDRLAFVRARFDTDIDVLEAGGTRTVVRSAFTDFQPAYSPDGRRIAFCSSRSANNVEVWVANADGSGAQQLTDGPGRWQCSPHWSPDGRRIAFDSRQSNGLHVWVVDADGGVPRQLTTEPGTQVAPTWSHDGQWVYYLWFDGKTQDVWRRPVTGGPPARVTHGGADFGMESADGLSLVYVPSGEDGPLLVVPVAGGAPRQLAQCVGRGGAFLPSPRGVYYVPCTRGGDTVVHLVDAATGRDTMVGSLGKPDSSSPHNGLAVSPDGARILFTKKVSSDGAELMLIENFR